MRSATITRSCGLCASQGTQNLRDLVSSTLTSGPLASEPRREHLAKHRKPRQLCVS
ncbi:hypothetical protein DPMN_162500 [Dreissena polymorpha]|uniref:Uncharacterized protein n=1 Tax=Dreissena polymorpha TaxID=45954 RepID=A0A9D4ESE0_DREPO|nr:hypothetical protein DPMN_162500 [Dreissena polymorpha]